MAYLNNGESACRLSRCVFFFAEDLGICEVAGRSLVASPIVLPQGTPQRVAASRRGGGVQNAGFQSMFTGRDAADACACWLGRA